MPEPSWPTAPNGPRRYERRRSMTAGRRIEPDDLASFAPRLGNGRPRSHRPRRPARARRRRLATGRAPVRHHRIRPAPAKSSLTNSADAASTRCLLWPATSCPISARKLANLCWLPPEAPSTTTASGPRDCPPDPRFLTERSLVENPPVPTPGGNGRSVGPFGAVDALPGLRGAESIPGTWSSPRSVGSSMPASRTAGFGAVGVGRRSCPASKRPSAAMLSCRLATGGRRRRLGL